MKMKRLSIPVDKNAKGLIFDCDGTLADTMGFHMDAWQKAFSKFQRITESGKCDNFGAAKIGLQILAEGIFYSDRSKRCLNSFNLIPL